MLEFKDHVKVIAWDNNTYRVLQRALKGEGESYIHNIAAAAFKNMQLATSRDEFIKLMLQDGYETDWTEKYRNIIFSDVKRREAGEKYYKIGTVKLQKYYNLDFTIEALEETFRFNAAKNKKRLDSNR